MQNTLRAAVACLTVSSVAACGGGGTVEPGPSPTPSTGLVGAPLALEGPARDEALAGQPYRYAPALSASAGASIEWRVENAPDWLTFDSGTGVLRGQPQREDVGSYPGIVIVARTGSEERRLEVTIDVVDVATGYALLRWDVPQQRSDGSPAGALEGYRIYYGRSAQQLDQWIKVRGGTVTEVQVSNLTRGTWYFAASVVDADGHESPLSAIGSKVVS